jgi:ABC-type lipoprotein export system ATPase subunit/multidrug efflux pump subunit AcrA (membrane-fusion protein)
LALLAGCKPSGGSAQFETVAATRGDIAEHVTASGTLSAVVSVDVGSQVSGKISTLAVDYNSPVKKGQLVAEIDPTVYAAALRQAQGELASANATVILKRQNLERKKILVPLKAASQLDLDQATAELAEADASVTINRPRSKARRRISAIAKSPRRWTASSSRAKWTWARRMTAGFTTPVLFTIAQDISKMNISASISEADIGQVKEGQPVDFTVDAFPEETFHGLVTQVRKSPTTTQNVVTYETIITVDNPEKKLFPGMTADVSILVAERKNVLKIPNTALRYSPPEGVTFEAAPPKTFGRNQRLIYALGANSSTLKPVLIKAGITDGVDTEILDGLGEHTTGRDLDLVFQNEKQRLRATTAAKRTVMILPVIQLRQLVKTYQTGDVAVKAVRGVTLDIARGEFVAVMGASGSGKSTLMNTLGCLDQPTGGNYFLDGVGVAGLDRKQLAVLRNRKLGFVFQSYNLLARTTAVENVELPMLYATPVISRRERRQRAIAALEKVGLGKRLDHHPNQLSGGQQQRIAIARALVNRPELVLADEPTGNLDSRTSIEIMGLFQELNASGITIIMVTHEIDIAAYCKRVIVMRDGKVINETHNATRRSAAAELATLDAVETEAQLN